MTGVLKAVLNYLELLGIDPDRVGVFFLCSPAELKVGAPEGRSNLV